MVKKRVVLGENFQSRVFKARAHSLLKRCSQACGRGSMSGRKNGREPLLKTLVCHDRDLGLSPER